MGLMHDSMARLYAAAKAIKEVEGQTALAKLLKNSPQAVNNWESRGISAEGALKAQERIGCDANWVMRGVGEMLPAWPFPKVPLERFLALADDDRGYVQRRLLQAIEECESSEPLKDAREQLRRLTLPSVTRPKSGKKAA